MKIIRLSAASIFTAALTACGGGEGSNSPAPQSIAPAGLSPQAPEQSTSTVTLSGKLTYDRVPHLENAGLDFANSLEMPIRGAVVEAISRSGDILAATQTGPDGTYSLSVNAQTELRIQAKAQLLSSAAASWDFSVTDNTNNNRLYALQGAFASSGENSSQIRDLHAEHGWNGQVYEGVRAAAPFAILDSVYDAAQVFAKIDPNIDFPPLELRWSEFNRTIIGDRSQGFIGSSAYFPDDDGGTIYILGEEGRDTDEFDAHVIVHEWGHYFEDRISRTDSIGGVHSLDDRLDARLALSEGWSNALSAIVTGDPVYKDSSGFGQSAGFIYDIENHEVTNPGWFNEASVAAIIYDIVDEAPDDADGISAGLGPIYDVMTSPSYIDTPVFMTIFALTDGLRGQDAIDNDALNALLEREFISGNGPDGAGEQNSGAILSALPIYKEVSLNGPAAQLCSVDDAGVFNKLGNREFIFLNLENADDVTLTLLKTSGDDSRDPDFNIWQGDTLLHGVSSSSFVSTTNGGQEVFQGRLSQGQYIIEAFDFLNINGASSNRGDSCYNFSVTAAR